MAMYAPSSPSRMAIAWPMPELAPVTRATFSCNPFIGFLLLDLTVVEPSCFVLLAAQTLRPRAQPAIYSERAMLPATRRFLLAARRSPRMHAGDREPDSVDAGGCRDVESAAVLVPPREVVGALRQPQDAQIFTAG